MHRLLIVIRCFVRNVHKLTRNLKYVFNYPNEYYYSNEGREINFAEYYAGLNI